jgi:hypothetical protein
MKREGESLVIDKIHSRCIIIKELTGNRSEEHIRDVFERIMGDIIIPVIDTFNLEMFSYAIRGNNFYFVITSLLDEEKVSRIIQFIKSRFAERYNQTMNRAGLFCIGGSACELID